MGKQIQNSFKVYWEKSKKVKYNLIKTGSLLRSILSKWCLWLTFPQIIQHLDTICKVLSTTESFI